MAEIRVKDNESLDSALRRFKKAVRTGWAVIQEVRKREAYESPLSSARKSQKQLASASISKSSCNHVCNGSGLFGPLFSSRHQAGTPSGAACQPGKKGAARLWDCFDPQPSSRG